MIETFFEKEILNTFPSQSCRHPSLSCTSINSIQLADTFDIYFTRGNTRIFLLDFNPYAPQTDSLLFTYGELFLLASTPSELPALRLITSSTMSSHTMPSFSHNRYPKDVVDISSGASIAEFAKEWNAKLAEGVAGSASSNDGDSIGR